MTRNLLADETSPYLLQHKDNPIHWMAWGEPAFTRARTEDKPILLSVGYAACHWCHVMAHESFEDPAIAERVNRDFVAIKVDREERPDVDKIYMDALHALGEHGGWPLTMFLTSDLQPFWGGTYFPKTPKYGKPGFAHVLTEIARIWQSERHKATDNAAALFQALTHQPQSADHIAITPASIASAAAALLRAIDFDHGGIRGAPKFPQSSLFKFFFHQSLRSHHPPLTRALTTTLEHMCQGGIYDHLGGGLSRYSVDHLWLAPHFEKMLYDNGQFIGLLARAWTIARNPLFLTRLTETVDFLLGHMRMPSGGFAASYDADSEGHEGTYYVWTETEIDQVLGADSAAFKTAYGVTAAGNWEGKSILNRLHAIADGPETTQRTARAKLLQQRQNRIPPGLDDKILADWNGLAITGLAEAALVTGNTAWAAAAEHAFAAVLKLLWSEATLRHSWRAGELRHWATIDGYANLMSAALALYALTRSSSYISISLELSNAAIRHHWNSDTGAFSFASRNATELIVQQNFGTDDATPNGNATMIDNLTKLARISGETRYGETAQALLTRFAGEASANPFGYATYLSAALNHIDPIEAVLTGADQNQEPDLIAALARNIGPDFILTVVDDPMALPDGHPAAGKPKGQRARLYLCRGMACAAPAETEAELHEALKLLSLPVRAIP